MHVFQLLKHHRIAHDRLRMRPFLPELMLALGLVWRAVVAQFAEEPGASFFFQELDDAPGCVAF